MDQFSIGSSTFIHRF